MPALDRLVKEQRVSFEIANKIISSNVVPIDLAPQLGLAAHAASAAVSGGHLDQSHLLHHQQPMHSYSVSPLNLPHGPNASLTSAKQMFGQPICGYPTMTGLTLPLQPQHLVGQFSSINLGASNSNNSRAASLRYIASATVSAIVEVDLVAVALPIRICQARDHLIPVLAIPHRCIRSLKGFLVSAREVLVVPSHVAPRQPARELPLNSPWIYPWMSVVSV